MKAICIILVIGIIILLAIGWMLDKLTEKHRNTESNIYRDAARERWQAEKKESLK